MDLLDQIKTAYKDLSLNKARSILTMLGVIIGVFAVVTLSALGKGVQNYITGEFEDLGSNLVYVSPGSGDFTGDPGTTFTRNKLDEKHIKLIKQHASEFVIAVIPFYIAGENLEFKTNSFYGEILGMSYDGVEVFGYALDKGRTFYKAEEKAKSKVIIIGPEVEKGLFGEQEAVGKKIKMKNDTYEIIGVFEPRGSNYDDGVVLPYTTMRTNFELDKFSYIGTQIDKAENVSVGIRQIELALLRDLDGEEFEILSQDDILSSIQDVLGVLTIALGAIAGISLVVGGIGIMNIMLVSVTERTREIGLRKAVGATPRIIATQFMIESILLSVTGGLVGLLLGFLVTVGVQSFLEAEITTGAVVMAFSFSVGVGVAFGTYPAISAAKKDAIEALRYE